MMSLFVISCIEEEELTENEIISPDFIEGVFYVEHQDDPYPIKIETNKPAKFLPNSKLQTFEISESGTAQLDLPQGVYWIDCIFEDKPNLVETIPILIMKNKINAVNTVAALRKMSKDGKGYAIVFRHTDARNGNDMVNSTLPEWWKSCDPEVARQMDGNGRNNGGKIGHAIKKLNIPIGLAVSSEFCRAVQTIEAMEIGVPIETDPRLNHENANTDGPIFEDVFDIIKENQTSGVQLLVGHYNMLTGNPYRNLFRPFNMSDAFLMKKNNNGGLDFVGSLPLYLWSLFD
jgi:phosphohistidine phosphatase SixA